jgi:hypothetical protein
VEQWVLTMLPNHNERKRRRNRQNRDVPEE